MLPPTPLSPLENEFREAVWEFSARVVKPKSEVIDREGGDSETHEYKTLIEVHKEMAEMGLHGVTVPTEDLTSSLGLGLSYTHHLLAMKPSPIPLHLSLFLTVLTLIYASTNCLAGARMTKERNGSRAYWTGRTLVRWR
ncbi:hypothetical protein DFJ43DRAFT_511743 [Lentinula guzmanii]|uniref:Acyl-CoA dehydrogenase/oxidase N-terminal domain-containing protein n=1 Tax=Lentinula guzmanii TaxID=2804957 RepID=A0AA38JIQ1_9AGAR|nr:hypothetical protein DFJ43DRAFT_511743 [Lentinula guzmanii]